MKKEGYYSSGAFAKMAQVSIRTIRFYDKQNILNPTYVNENGARFYTDSDLARLQQILLLKYLGFSLEDIKGMLVDDLDMQYLQHSLKLQKQLVLDRMEQMELVANAIDNTIEALDQNQTEGSSIQWSHMLDLIHLTGMEKSMKSQYQNASNISARIQLHREFSVNKQGWFPWVFDQCRSLWEPCLVPTNVGNPSVLLENENPFSDNPGIGKHTSSKFEKKKPYQVLEIGCGNGALWAENKDRLPDASLLHISLSDLSGGMIRDIRRNLDNSQKQFSFATFDGQDIPYKDGKFDMVIANHVLFYCQDIPQVCQEISRVLKPGGVFLCSTYSSQHMKEITELVQEFDQRIVLAGENLFDRFGLENGAEILSKDFSSVTLRRYPDGIILTQAEPLIEYILSCHGNQNQYILDRYHDFRLFIEKKVGKEFHITKDAGLFICQKN